MRIRTQHAARSTQEKKSDSFKSDKSLNAENRRGGLLVGRSSRREPQLDLKCFNRGPLPFDKLMVLSKRKCVEGRQRLQGGAYCLS